MSWDNVKLIFTRELRDQARDRRTLFSVIGLPVLLYPLMGLLVLQIMQFRQTHPTRLRVIGQAELPSSPELLVPAATSPQDTAVEPGYTFAPWLLEEVSFTGQFEIEITEASVDPDVVQQTARETLEADGLDAILYFPPGFRERIESFRNAQRNGATEPEPGTKLEFPMPQLFVNSSNERSDIANGRLRQIMHGWRERVIQQNLEANNVPAVITNPFKIEPVDLSEKPRDQSSYLWAKIFPFIVVIWALTGAFYPAIDLCAGEKERGTLETLLSSPALRSEIVAGKLLAIMAFSIATSVLNLLSMGVTAGLVMGQVTDPALNSRLNFGPPPIWSLGWLFLALIPMSALFSALALAIATMARSSKEGQYYLLPLLMLNLPLVVLPVLPDTELSFGTSLIPVSGMSFLLKSLMEGDYQKAATYTIPVLGVTAFCIWVAVRWAIDQFNNESVLFRESERLNLRLWVTKTWRDRQTTPSASAAFVMGIFLLALPHMLGRFMSVPTSAPGFAWYMSVTQIGFILLPVLLAGWIFTRSMSRTFLLRMPPFRMLGAAALLAVCVHPFSIMLGKLIREAIPFSQDLQARMETVLAPAQELPMWAILALIALLPAICEEFAFRGFILSGLRHLGHKWAAISISAIFFGMLHGVIQQSISAAIVGLLIGFVAVQTRSLLPGILYHLLHNSMSLGYGLITDKALQDHPWLPWLVSSATSEPGEAIYQPFLVGLCALGTLLLIGWFQSLPSELSSEERRQAALDHQGAYSPTPNQPSDHSPSA